MSDNEPEGKTGNSLSLFSWRKRGFLLAVLGMSGVASALSFWANSYNEAMPGGTVRTQIGNYKSLDSLGLLPVVLFAALRKFPSFDECTTPAGDQSFHPDWEAMTNEQQIRVCIFWIAARLDGVDETQMYFSDLGFRSLSISYKDEIKSVFVGCPGAKADCILPDLTIFLMWIIPIKPPYDIELTYERERLVDVGVGYEIL